MTDLTDSYCERCGARYVFSPPAPKTMSLKGARVLAKGLKNFVLNDGQSMADSLTIARHDDSHESSTRITEAFHRTFNFCMTCRQYACDNCWNKKVGACLSCSPEPGFEPMAQEDHLIVRTPVARWDMDWSLFPDGPLVEPVNRPDPPLPFNAPIVFSDSVPAVETERPADAAWPQMDLPPEEPAGPAGHVSKTGHRTASKHVDAEAASLWPLADEIAPEMTLTAEELELVETRLSRTDIPPDAAAAETSPLAAAAPIAGGEPEPDVAPAMRPTWAGAFAPKPEAAAAGREAMRAAMSATDPALVAAREPAIQQRPEHMPRQSPGRLPQAAEPAPVQATLPAPAPLAPDQIAEQTQHSNFVGRLLGHDQESGAAVPNRPRHATKRSGQTSVDAWPHVTPWSQRPAEAPGWRGDEHAAADDIEPVSTAGHAPADRSEVTPDAPLGAAPYAPAPAPAAAAGFPVVDARTAAAVRLSAVPADPTPDPAAGLATTEDRAAQTAAGPVPFLESPSWARAEDPSLAEPDLEADLAAARDSLRPAGTSSPRTDAAAPGTFRNDTPQKVAPPAQVPPSPVSQAPATQSPAQAARPLGSTWPAPRDPAAPWASPDVPNVPSILSAVAAQQSGPANLTEMWVQSSEQVMNRGTVRVCHRCALPDSTQARFCRRCGTKQS